MNIASVMIQVAATLGKTLSRRLCLLPSEPR